jgi:hypothetical protein
MSGPARSSGEGLSFACKTRSSLGQRMMRVFHELLTLIFWYFYMNCQVINTSCLSCEKRSKIIVDLRVKQPFAPLLG